MTKKKKRQITIRGDSVDIIDRLCDVTGLTSRHVVELLLRKYGKEIELWVGSPYTETPVRSTTMASHNANAPVSPPPASPPPPPVTPQAKPSLELPKDPGKGLKAIEL